MNSELKLVVFEEKRVLQELLELLDQQYNAVLDTDVIKIETLTGMIENAGRNLAAIEIKRRDIVKEENFKSIIEASDDSHIKNIFEEIKILLKNLELQKSTNDTLIKQRLFFTNKMINVIKPSKSIGTYNSYGKVNR